MINFDDIFDDSSDTVSPEEDRKNRLVRDDKDLFDNKRLHEQRATMSMARTSNRDFDAQTYRATKTAPNGKPENIGLIFKGQRLDDLKSGSLLSEMEADRQARLARGDMSDGTREVDFTGAWKPRSWKDAEGKQHKAFDLVVASWTFTNQAGERVTEGAAPTVPTASREDERAAAVRKQAESRAQARAPKRSADRDDLGF
jgi:hypothetical protein